MPLFLSINGAPMRSMLIGARSNRSKSSRPGEWQPVQLGTCPSAITFSWQPSCCLSGISVHGKWFGAGSPLMDASQHWHDKVGDDY